MAEESPWKMSGLPDIIECSGAVAGFAAAVTVNLVARKPAYSGILSFILEIIKPPQYSCNENDLNSHPQDSYLKNKRIIITTGLQ